MRQRGFTLIEMMVAIALFSVVMLVTTSSLLALVAANQKAQALHSVMENLNIAVDGMIRAARMGTSYHCDDSSIPVTATHDCTTGASSVAFESYGGNPNTSTDQRLYWFAQDANGIGRLYESTTGDQSGGIPVTSAEVDIDTSHSKFYVSGSTPQDTQQPKMIVVIQGTASTGKVQTKTSFTIQATASQRALDL